MTTNSPLDAPLLTTEPIPYADLWATIGYGKGVITVYRLDVAGQDGVKTITESSFAGRPGPLLAAELSIETTGAAFFGSWSDGDNSRLVATDTMKNFALHRSSTYSGTTVEGLAAHVGLAMLAQYPDMERLRVSGRHLPFAPTGTTGTALQRLRAAGVMTTVDIERGPQGPVVTGVTCGLDDLRFVRLRGSSFAGFPRDEYTTLPEASNRPLEIGLSLRWFYGDPGAAISDDLGEWAAAEAIEDLVGWITDSVGSGSIQQMLTAFGRAILDRWPALSRVWLEGENRVWSKPAVVAPEGGAEVHTAALPAHGVLRLALDRRSP